MFEWIEILITFFYELLDVINFNGFLDIDINIGLGVMTIFNFVHSFLVIISVIIMISIAIGFFMIPVKIIKRALR